MAPRASAERPSPPRTSPSQGTSPFDFANDRSPGSIIDTNAQADFSTLEFSRNGQQVEASPSGTFSFKKLPDGPGVDRAPVNELAGNDLERVLSEMHQALQPPTFSPPTKFDGAEFRRWTDNTGAYQIEARLAVIFPDKVRLLKPSGRTTTVSMNRLSPFDQDYVRWVAGTLSSDANRLVDADSIRNQQAYPSR
jgi:hypothetical protein